MKDSQLQKIKEIVSTFYNNRKIVVWGAGNNSRQVQEMVEENFGEVTYFVDKDPAKENGTTICNVEKIKDMAEELYVCVSISKYYNEIERELSMLGYRKNEDYCYLPELICNAEQYEDYYGNKIIGNLKDANIVFQGNNSVLEVGDKTKANKLTLFIQSNCTIKLGNNVSINKENHNLDTRWYFRDNSRFEMGNTIVFWGNGFLNCNMGSSLKIGSKVTIQRNYLLIICEGTEAVIGYNSMISYDFSMFTNDAHPIWDLDSGECINDCKQHKCIVDIGEHVWIGYRVTVLKQSYIGNGSIVGSGSVVNKKHPNNCVIAGNPAKLIRKNVAWNQRGELSDVLPEYAQKTKEL